MPYGFTEDCEVGASPCACSDSVLRICIFSISRTRISRTASLGPDMPRGMRRLQRSTERGLETVNCAGCSRPSRPAAPTRQATRRPPRRPTVADSSQSC
eukprot:5426547-Prymnesium_polylepis.1